MRAIPPPLASELTSLGGLELAGRLHRREVSAVEVVQAFLDRIDRFNNELHAFVDVFRRRALLAARLADQALRRSASRPPLYGVPIGIKDTQFVRGSVSRFGSRALPRIPSPLDDRVVRRIRAGGLLILGKLSTSEFGVMPVVEPDIHPPTRNPWDLDRSSGGSSGGSGAALAARLLPVAHGSDGAGSIRIPSAFCGLCGLKPSRGVVPSAYGEPDQRLLYTSGPMARTTEDVAALLDVMALQAPGALERPAGSYLEACRRPPPRLRVRLLVSSFLGAASPECRAAAERAARCLEELGHRVEPADPPGASLDEFLPLYGHIFAHIPLVRWSRTQPVTRWVASQGRLSAADAASLHDRLSGLMHEWWEGTDLVLTPTTPEVAPPVGSLRADDPEAQFRRAANLGAFTAAFNLSGQPALSIPAAISSEHLPIGVQIAGALRDDALVLQVGRQLEEAVGPLG
jgi:amidase